MDDSNQTQSFLPKHGPLVPFLIGIVVCFAWPLYHLARLSLRDDLYSHILLVPLVSIYLIWTDRAALQLDAEPNRRNALILWATGVALAIFSLLAAPLGSSLAPDDGLVLYILSFVILVIGTCCWFLGRATVRALAFPLLFLVFMVPFPAFMRSGLETFLQHGSAEFAHLLFRLCGTTVYYQDLLFRLPGINLEVAPECSGIRSSLALFITSLIAGHFFLRTRWKCAVLTLAVIPLALVRNGFRIFTIGELCVHVSPDMINSYIHRQGGPVFFVLSLIPFFLLLRVLYRSEPPLPPRRPPETT